MSTNVLVVAECPQIWDKLHKIRIRKVEAARENTTTYIAGSAIAPPAGGHNERKPTTSISTSKEVNKQIVNYVLENSTHTCSLHSNPPQESEITVQVYHSDAGMFVPLLDPAVQDNFREIFGTRIRCIISFQNNNNPDTRETLLIKGRFYEYNPNGMDYAGKTLIVKEEVNNREEDGTGLNVWDGSLLLARYLEQNPEKVKGRTVLELGSGPAVVGIAAALLDAEEIILSDLDYTLPLMKNNVSLNENAIDPKVYERIRCMEIDWFNPPDINSISTGKMFPQVMLIADCVWLEELVNPLMNTIEKLCQKNTEVVITYQRRGRAAHNLFWNRLRGIFSCINDVDTIRLCKLDKPESISLLICRR